MVIASVEKLRMEKKDWKKAVLLKPDLIFVDIKMPVMSGLTMVKEIHGLELGCEIVMLTCYEDFDYVREAMRCGAADYLLKHTFEDEDLKELLRRIEKRIQKEENRMESLNLLKENVFEKLISDTLSREKSEDMWRQESCRHCIHTIWWYVSVCKSSLRIRRKKNLSKIFKQIWIKM